MNSTQGGHMSNKQNEEWLEAVKECLLEMTVDIHVFNQALNGQTGADVIAKYGNSPPHYVAELLLDTLHEKHVQKKLQS